MILNQVFGQAQDLTPQRFIGKSLKQIYRELSVDFYLPSFKSKVMRKSYLFRVFREEVFSVRRQELDMFWAALTLGQRKLNGTFYVVVETESLQNFLRIYNLLPLGFNDSYCPDEEWLKKCIRFTDQSNLLEVYITPLRSVNIAPESLIKNK